jgi:hypothetical protein
MESKNYLPLSISDTLPAMVRNELVSMPANKQEEFLEEYHRKAKSVGIAYLLWFLGLHYAYVGKWGLLVLFLLTFGFGLIWWIIDLFRVYGIIINYNKDVAIDVLRNLRTVSSDPAK